MSADSFHSRAVVMIKGIPEKEYKHQWYISHKDIQREKGRIWAKNHQKQEQERSQRRLQTLRLQALQLITKQETPSCTYCGCNDLRFLQINHKNGGGKRELKVAGRTGISFYRDIVWGKRITEDLEVTCAPCNILHYLKLKYGVAANRLKVIWVGE